jgi:hypothetical protein
MMDKNGKLVTRHVRSKSAPPVLRTRIPGPDTVTLSGGQLADALMMSVDDVWLQSEGFQIPFIMQSARRLPTETAEALLGKRKFVKKGGAFDYVVVSAIHQGCTTDRLENIALFYNDDQYEGFFEQEGAAEVYRVISEDLNGLNHYRQLDPEVNYSRADKDTQNRAKVLVGLMQEADKNGGIRIVTEGDGTRCAVLKDEGLVELALENSHQWIAFLDLAESRGLNPEVLREALKTIIPLRSGVL